MANSYISQALIPGIYANWNVPFPGKLSWSLHQWASEFVTQYWSVFSVPWLKGHLEPDYNFAIFNVPWFKEQSEK
jgi:hypothetical protein